MTLEQAKAFLNSGIKHGVYSPEMFEGWSDEQLIQFATYEDNKVDNLYTAYKEEQSKPDFLR